MRGADAVAVEPSDLAERPDLVGRTIAVEDWVQYFQSHDHPGLGPRYDEVRLVRAGDVPFRLPRRLWTASRPEAGAVRLEGVLKKEQVREMVGADGVLAVDVTRLELLPRDLDRLEAAVRAMPADNYKDRAAWARWARRRGATFAALEGQPSIQAEGRRLRDRGRDLEAEALRIEADQRPADDRPALWLELAGRAREHDLPESVATGLAVRAFEDHLKAATTAAELERVADQVNAFFPGAEESGSAAPAHRLWAEATQKALERRAADDPHAALSLADAARQRLPDRPEVADRLRDRALEGAEHDVRNLGRDEVLSLARILREDRQEPGRATTLVRAWLDDQRLRRLSRTDAEGRVLLAAEYQALLNDTETAVDLLREAAAIDPGTRGLVEAFRRLGYRREGDRWVPYGSAAAEPREAAPPKAGDPLRGLTRAEVRAQLGAPTRIARTATQGQVTEQWIYLGTGTTQYINFLQQPGRPEARVQGHFSLPGAAFRK